MVERLSFTISLSDKTKRFFKNERMRNSARMNSALFRGFYNARKIIFSTVERNTNKEYPSEPGTSWARRSGRANKGLTFAVNSGKAYFGNTVPYVKYLELGTKKMEKRPAMWISLNENKTNIAKCLEDAINKEYKVKRK